LILQAQNVIAQLSICAPKAPSPSSDQSIASNLAGALLLSTVSIPRVEGVASAPIARPRVLAQEASRASAGSSGTATSGCTCAFLLELRTIGVVGIIYRLTIAVEESAEVLVEFLRYNELIELLPNGLLIELVRFDYPVDGPGNVFLKEACDSHR